MSGDKIDKRKETSRISIQKARATRKKNQEEKFKLLSEINNHEKLVIEKYGINTYITRRINNLETMILALSKKLDRIQELKEKEIDNNKLNDIILLLKEINMRIDFKEKSEKKKGGNALNNVLRDLHNKYN